MFKSIRREIQVVFERDPAARNLLEVLLCYPGFHAIVAHRINHWFWNKNFKLFSRWASHLVRFFTGIEIHPGAIIGNDFFIDHGMGVIIGETSVIGDQVTIYQGVTLGGVSWKKEKRHPTLEDHVVVGANAVILGPVRIGHHCRIGAASVVIHDVPPQSTVVGVPGKVVSKLDNFVGEHDDLSHNQLPDIEMHAIAMLRSDVKELQEKVAALMNKQTAA